MNITTKPTQLKTLLEATIKARLPILVTGAPGIGKSDIVISAAAACDADVILSHPAVSDPTDAKGLPWPMPNKTEATFLPYGELARALKAEKSTVWFLDDLGQASPAVQASFMQLLLARRVNGHVLPDCVTFVAATNRRIDRAGVSGILEPVKSRFATIIELETDINDWCNWALGNNIPPTMIAFLRFRPELLSKFEPSADLSNSPTPRTWAHAARLEGLGLPASIELKALAGAVGDGASAEYIAFRQMFASLPSIDAIIMDPEKAKIPTEPGVLYAVATALASRVTIKNFSRICRYAERLNDNNYGEFAALLVRDCQRRDAGISSTQAFVKLACGPLGQLISGAEVN